jgi:hypothetical protein
MLQGCLNEIHKLPNHKSRPRLYMVLCHLILWVKPMYFHHRYFRDFLEAVGPLGLYENPCPFPRI